MVAGVRMATLLPIRNMNRAIRFYTKTVGGKLISRMEGEMKDFWASVKVGDSEIWLITPEKREKRTLAYSTFVVKDIKAFVNGLKRKGVKFRRAERLGPETKLDGPIAYEPFGASAFFKDPEGNVMMVWQNHPSG